MGQALNAEAHPDDVPDEPGIEPSYLIESAIIFVFGGPPRWALGAMELRGAIAGRAALATDIVVVEGVGAGSVVTWKTLGKEGQNAVNNYMTQYGKGASGAKKLLQDINKNGVPKGLDKKGFQVYKNEISSIGGNKPLTSQSEVFNTRLQILNKILDK